MDTASNYPTQAMTSQETRDWVASAVATQEELTLASPASPSHQFPKAAADSSWTLFRDQHPRQHSPSTTKSPDFLWLIPSNETAKLAFSELIVQKRAGRLSDYHGQYIVDNGKGPLRLRGR
ncbi:hypothetical protein JMJ35_001816 [Cladonia borealis]|uniref:Uncharacterized protein n=1 Tax=Cladonia borealis TaxID=184061 RepID=A0AA39R6F4_9LECA|nr:hypothetical protein JMJ35_001816 [Cladonia borealis]